MYVIKSIAYKKSLTVPKKNSHKQACRTRFVRLRLWSPCKVFDQVTYTPKYGCPKENSHKQACRTRSVRLRLWSPCEVFDQVTYTSDFKAMDNPFI